jgi:hypothetical protein
MSEAARLLRSAERFLVAPPLPARFGDDSVSLCDISETGARLRHAGRFEMGAKSTLHVAVSGHAHRVEAMVVWTQPDSANVHDFVSGVRAYGASDVMKSIVQQLAHARRTTPMEELRKHDRYDVRPALAGAWNGDRVRIEDISTHGARIETAQRQPIGTPGRLRFAVPNAELHVDVAAAVVWSALKAIDGEEAFRFHAGLMIAERADLVRLAVGQLCSSGHAVMDVHSLPLKLKIARARARKVAPSFRALYNSGVPADQFLLIQGVREELRVNGDEAMQWYRRARVVIADPATRALAPAIADHPDALAVWEYLDRSVDPSLISRAFAIG